MAKKIDFKNVIHFALIEISHIIGNLLCWKVFSYYLIATYKWKIFILMISFLRVSFTTVSNRIFVFVSSRMAFFVLSLLPPVLNHREDLNFDASGLFTWTSVSLLDWCELLTSASCPAILHQVGAGATSYFRNQALWDSSCKAADLFFNRVLLHSCLFLHSLFSCRICVVCVQFLYNLLLCAFLSLCH